MQMKVFHFVAILCFILRVGAVGECRGRRSVIRNGKEYRLFSNAREHYGRAVNACRQWGAHWNSPGKSDLVKEINKELQTCLREMIEDGPRVRIEDWSVAEEKQVGYFIGGLRPNSTAQSEWFWDVGKPIPLGTDTENFQKWAENEPFYQTNTPRPLCMSALRNGNGQRSQAGDWVAQNCQHKMYYICQRDVSDELLWGFSENEHAIPPQKWGSISDSDVCATGTRQSPQNVNVSLSINACTDNDVTTVSRWGSDGTEVFWNVTNTGRMVKIRIQPERSLYTQFEGDDRKYYVEQMYLKWGSDYRSGSEHTTSGVGHAGELQIFHHPHNGERHALSFLLQERYFIPNDNWRNLLQRIHRVREAGSSAIMPSPADHIATLLGDSARNRIHVTARYNTAHAVRYKGSLPHPPCTENVIWTVYPRTIELSLSQFNLIRQLQMEGRQDDNSRRIMTQTTRPIQPLLPSQSDHCLVRR